MDGTKTKRGRIAITEKVGGDLVPFDMDEKQLRDEVNSRTSKAGYTTRYGEPPCRSKIMIMPANDKYRENYDKIDWSKK